MSRLFPRLAAVSLAVGCTATAPIASATPRHRICDDLGPALGTGVATFSQAGDWPTTASTMYGVHWQFAYTYVVATTDPPDAVASYLRSKIALAQSLNATPVFTLYEILQVGMNAGFTGSEPDIVRQALQSASTMRTYYDNVIFVLRTAADSPVPVILQVEPDLFGFMMWSMGVDGNADGTSIPVQVGSSGHPDVAGLPDHAGGFGHALLALRDRYAPNVRMGWHASNWRAGDRPEIAAGLYSSMGDWDVITGEQPHMEANDAEWWLDWDETRVQHNLQWFSTLSHAANLPIILWQMPIGTTDWHLFRDPMDQSMLARWANSGVAAILFDTRGTGDPDQFRATEIPALGTVPPADSGAGGTAADMRTRLAAYSMHPLAWPAGSPCAASATVDAGVVDGSTTGDAGDAARNATDGATIDVPRDAGGDGGSTMSGGCGCHITGVESRPRNNSLLLALGLGLTARSRRRRAGVTPRCRR